MAVTTSARQSVDCLAPGAPDPFLLEVFFAGLLFSPFLDPFFLLLRLSAFFLFFLALFFDFLDFFFFWFFFLFSWLFLFFFCWVFFFLPGSAFLASLWSVPSERDSWDSSSFCSRPETRTRAKAPRMITAFILL